MDDPGQQDFIQPTFRVPKQLAEQSDQVYNKSCRYKFIWVIFKMQVSKQGTFLVKSTSIDKTQQKSKSVVCQFKAT